MNIEQIDDICLGTWPTTCSTWPISFFMATAWGSQGLPISHPQINFSPLNGLVHKLLYLWYPHTIEINENVYIFYCLHDFWHRKPRCKRSLCFTEPRYFSIREFHKFAKFSFTKCVYAVNSSKFPTAKVSLYTVLWILWNSSTAL